MSYRNICDTLNCPAILVIVLSCCILILLSTVSALVCGRRRERRKKKEAEQSMRTVEMEFQFLGNLYDNIASAAGESV